MQFPFELPENKEFDVIGFGTNAVDYLIQVPEYPAFDSKIELVDYLQAAGGEVATTMVGLKRLGLKTSYIGRFGDDDAGDFGMRSLIDEGVHVGFAEQIEGARTQIAFILIDVRNGERTVIWHRDDKLAYTSAEAPVHSLKSSRILHFTPHDVSACIAMAESSKKNGIVVSCDIDNVFDGIEELIPHVDLLMASSEFPVKLLGISNKKEALLELRSRFGCGIIGVTLGEKGSLLLCGDTFVETPGYAVPGGCKDTTGAGDSFRVGLLYGLIKGESVEESAKMANAVAASEMPCCRRPYRTSKNRRTFPLDS